MSHVNEREKNNLKTLEALRGLAALYVLFHHSRLLLTQPFKNGYQIHPEYYSFIDKLMMYSFAGFKFGHQAVIFFFVLSGFVIHLKQASNMNEGYKLKTYSFYLKRFIRIYPTVIIAMILAFGMDYLWSLISNYPLNQYTISSFIQNLLLLPNLKIWGNNYPMWSLQHEWSFYLLYPLLYLVSLRHYLYSFCLTLALFLLYIFAFPLPVLGDATYTILYWWLGAGLAEVYSGRYLKGIRPFSWLIPFGILCLALPLNYSLPISDLLFSVVCLGIIAFSVGYDLRGKGRIYNYLLFSGKFSFSIYLLHFPLLNFLKNLVLFYEKALPYHLWYSLLAPILVMPIIYMLYLWSEKPAQILKTRLFY